MTLLFGPNTSLRFKLLLPPLLVLLFLLSTLSIVGNNWLREVSQRMAQSHADARVADLAHSPLLTDALLRSPEKNLAPLLNGAVDNDPRMLFAVLKLRDQLFIGTRSGTEGEQLSLLLADQKRHSNLAQNVT